MPKDKFKSPCDERRFTTSALELRNLGEIDEQTGEPQGAPVISGYAAKFNRASENLGSADYQFIEIIEPGAFDGVLNDDVRALFNHDPNAILARSKDGQGTLKLEVDEIGLRYEFEAPDTQAGRDLVTSMRRGDIDGSSFGFTVAKGGDKWESRRDGEGPEINVRTITKIARLGDVSPVTYPAYPDTSAAVRSLQEVKKTQEPPAPEAPTEAEISEVADWAARFGL